MFIVLYVRIIHSLVLYPRALPVCGCIAFNSASSCVLVGWSLVPFNLQPADCQPPLAVGGQPHHTGCVSGMQWCGRHRCPDWLAFHVHSCLEPLPHLTGETCSSRTRDPGFSDLMACLSGLTSVSHCRDEYCVLWGREDSECGLSLRSLGCSVSLHIGRGEVRYFR